MQYTNAAQSPQQFLHNLLNAVIFSEIKAYLIIHFSYYLLKQQTECKCQASSKIIH